MENFRWLHDIKNFSKFPAEKTIVKIRFNSNSLERSLCNSNTNGNSSESWSSDNSNTNKTVVPKWSNSKRFFNIVAQHKTETLSINRSNSKSLSNRKIAFPIAKINRAKKGNSNSSFNTIDHLWFPVM